MTDDPTRLSDTETWIRSTTLNRRGVIGGVAAAAGYALAAQPVSAAPVRTSSEGLEAGWVTVPMNGFNMRAYRARPAGRRRAPVILVVHEIFGVHEWVQDIVRRFARAGYYAIAPDLFQRAGDATKVPDIKTLVETIVTKTPDTQVMADLDATAVFAGTDRGQAARLGITGYCWGGRITWLYAAHQPRLKAGVALYGNLVAGGRNKTGPIEFVDQLKAPVLGQYGALDRGIPLTDVERMRAALVAAKSPSRIDVFPDADHGFLADYRPSYNEAAARKAWSDGLAWFKRYL